MSHSVVFSKKWRFGRLIDVFEEFFVVCPPGGLLFSKKMAKCPLSHINDENLEQIWSKNFPFE